MDEKTTVRMVAQATECPEDKIDVRFSSDDWGTWNCGERYGVWLIAGDSVIIEVQS